MRRVGGVRRGHERLQRRDVRLCLGLLRFSPRTRGDIHHDRDNRGDHGRPNERTPEHAAILPDGAGQTVSWCVTGGRTGGAR